MTSQPHPLGVLVQHGAALQPPHSVPFPEGLVGGAAPAASLSCQHRAASCLHAVPVLTLTSPPSSPHLHLCLHLTSILTSPHLTSPSPSPPLTPLPLSFPLAAPTGPPVLAVRRLPPSLRPLGGRQPQATMMSAGRRGGE